MHMTCQKYTNNPCIAKTQNNMVVVLGHFSCSCSWLLPRRLIPPPQHVCVLGTNRTPTPSLLMLMFLLSVVPSPDRGFCSWSSHSAVRLHSVEVLLCGLCVSPATPSTQTDYKALRHPGGVHTYLLQHRRQPRSKFQRGKHVQDGGDRSVCRPKRRLTYVVIYCVGAERGGA